MPFSRGPFSRVPSSRVPSSAGPSPGGAASDVAAPAPTRSRQKSVLVLLGTLVGLFVGFVVFSLFPALAQSDQDSASLVSPAMPFLAGFGLLLSRSVREGGFGLMRGLATGLLTGGLVGLVLTVLVFGMGPF
jgi:hypothetical protein